MTQIIKTAGKAWAILALSALVLALGTACGAGQDEEGGSPPTVPQVFRAQISGEPETLDPAKGGFATDITVLRQIFRGLVYFDKDLYVVGAAAKDVPSVENGGISEDGLTYTFKLRDDLKWSDGTPLTAADWEYSLKRFFDPTLGGNQYYQSFYYDIAGAMAYHTALGTPDEPASPTPGELATLRNAVGVRAVDGGTLEVKLERPRPTFLYLMALWPGYPLPQAAIEKYGDAWTEAGNMVSNGPFLLKEWAHNQRIALERNPYYFGPTPGLERIEFLVISDATTALQAYRNGQLDYTAAPPAQLAELKNDPEFHAQAELTTFAVSYNNQRAPFDNALVRRALGKAVDRQAYVDVVEQGIGVPTTTWVPPGMPGYDAEAGKTLEFDPDASKALLAQAGYPNGNGLPEITLTSVNTDTGKLAAEFAKEQWAKNLGLNVGIEVLEPATYAQRFGASEFQVVFGGWGADYPHPENWIPQLFGTGASANQYLYSNARVDDLIERAAAELKAQVAVELYKQAQRIILDEDAGIVPIFHNIATFMLKPYVQGLVFTGTDGEVRGDVLLASPEVRIVR